MFFAINIILAFVWAGLMGSINMGTLTAGFVLGYGVLFLIQRALQKPSKYFTKLPAVIRFIFFYIKEILISNFVIAYDILTPSHHMTPGVIAIPLDAKTDLEITMLANLITMTPGTFSIDVSSDHKVLYIHAMYIKDPDALRTEIKTNLEQRVLEILR